MASAAAVHNAVKRAKNFQEDDNIRTVFSKYDTTGDGAMDLEELYCALKDQARRISTRRSTWRRS